MESAERGLISLPGSKSLETLQVRLVPSGGSRRPPGLAAPQDGPDGTCNLVGQSHRGKHRRLSTPQPAKPGIGAQDFRAEHGRHGAANQQAPETPVAPFGDAAEAALAA